jgi:NADH-quinone oxidoreductase subunit J
LASDALLFWAFAGVAVIGSLLVVTQKNPVYSVLALIGAFFGLSGLYVLLEAPFVAVVQIIIYAGAIMVLFLFTVMLLNVPREDAAEWDRTHPLYRPMAVRIGAVLAVLLALEFGWALSRTGGLGAGIGDENAAASSVAVLGRVLFTDYMFAFEVTSILIIVAMVGAVILARRRED